MWLMKNEVLWATASKYRHLPIIVAAASMADMLGLTSTAGKMQYIGDEKYENDDIVCMGPKGDFTGNCALKFDGQLRLMNGAETIASLVAHDWSDWALTGLCRGIRRLPSSVKWWEEIDRRGLRDKLFEELEAAIDLHIDDASIIEAAKYRLNTNR